MKIEDAIVTFGRRAVIGLGRMSGVRAETMIPEECIGVFIASDFVDALNWDARREVSNETMLKECAYVGDPAVKRELGGFLADLAVYDGGVPSSIIEIKKVEYQAHIDAVKGARGRGWRVTGALSRVGYGCNRDDA